LQLEDVALAYHSVRIHCWLEINQRDQRPSALLQVPEGKIAHIMERDTMALLGLA
jgi:hypothetical protein